MASSGLKHGAPASSRTDVLNSQLSPVKNQLPRRISLVAFASARIFSVLLFTANNPIAAQQQALEECVERLARKAAALPHEHRMSLVWTNHATLSEQRAERWRALFAAQLEAAQIRLVQGEAAPALRVSIEQTPSRIVFTASVPAEGSTNVAIEEVMRSLAGSDNRPSSPVRLEKELLWQQEARILSAVLPGDSAGAKKKMVLLTEDAMLVYGEEQRSWKLLTTKPLPGPKQPPRSAQGQLVLADENLERVGILLPGRRCEATLADDSGVACVPRTTEWPSGRLLANPGCGTQTWWLKSDAIDWTRDDRLLLRNSGAGSSAAPVAELSVPGTVYSIGAGPNAASAVVVTRNLSTGNFEVYRVALACAN